MSYVNLTLFALSAREATVFQMAVEGGEGTCASSCFPCIHGTSNASVVRLNDIRYSIQPSFVSHRISIRPIIIKMQREIIRIWQRECARARALKRILKRVPS